VTSKFEQGNPTEASLTQDRRESEALANLDSPHSTTYQGGGGSPAPSREESHLHYSQWQSESPPFNTPDSVTVSFPDNNSLGAENGRYAHPSPRSASQIYSHRSSDSQIYPGTSQYHTSTDGLTPNHASPNSRNRPEDAAADLLALRYLQQSKPPNTMSQVLMGPPSDRTILTNVGQAEMVDHEIFDDQQDGIFLPGSVFQEFHSTLRDHLIFTAQSNCPTRAGTPEFQVPDQTFPKRLVSRGEGTEVDPESNGSSRSLEITPQREYVLWKAWINELAPWVSFTPPYSSPAPY